MSLRPMLYASDPSKLQKAFGSGDEALAAKVVAALEKRIDPKSHGKALRAVADDLRKAVREGVPVAGLREESEPHAVAVDVLATHLGLDAQDAMVHDGDWKHYAWEDYLEEAGDDLDDATTRLMEYLVHGRPILAPAIKSGWSYYAFLFPAEVRQLRDGLNAAAKKNPDLADEDFIDGFHSELVGWLGTIAERRKGLWLFAS